MSLRRLLILIIGDILLIANLMFNLGTIINKIETVNHGYY